MAALPLALVTGCAYIPPLTHQFNRKDIAALRPGVDTRARVDSLVAPDVTFLSTPRLLGIEKRRSGGTLIVAAAGPQGAGGGGIRSFTSQRYRMLFRFDEQDVLKGFEVEPSRAEHEPVPGQPELPVESSPAESLSLRSPWAGGKPHLTCVAADAAGRIAAGDAKGRVWLWPAGEHADPMGLELGEHVGTRRERTLEHSWVRLAFTDSARALACLAADGTLALVSLPPAPWAPAGPKIVAPRWIRRRVTALDASPKGTFVAAALRDRSVALLDAATGVVRASSAHERKLTPVAITLSPDGCRLAMVEEQLPYARLRILDCCRAVRSGLPDVAVYPLEGAYRVMPGGNPWDLTSTSPPVFLQASVQVEGLRFSADGCVLVVEALSHVRWLSRTEGSRSGGDSLTLSGAFLRPFAASDLLDETRRNAVSRVCPPTFACDGSAIAIVADRLLVYQATDSRAAPRCLLQGSRRMGSVSDLAAIPGTRRIVAVTNRGLFVWEVPLAPR